MLHQVPQMIANLAECFKNATPNLQCQLPAEAEQGAGTNLRMRHRCLRRSDVPVHKRVIIFGGAPSRLRQLAFTVMPSAICCLIVRNLPWSSSELHRRASWSSVLGQRVVRRLCDSQQRRVTTA